MLIAKTPARCRDGHDHDGEAAARAANHPGGRNKTAAITARLAFSGTRDRYPDLTVIARRRGGLVPMPAGGTGPVWYRPGARAADKDYVGPRRRLRKGPILWASAGAG